MMTHSENALTFLCILLHARMRKKNRPLSTATENLGKIVSILMTLSLVFLCHLNQHLGRMKSTLLKLKPDHSEAHKKMASVSEEWVLNLLIIRLYFSGLCNNLDTNIGCKCTNLFKVAASFPEIVQLIFARFVYENSQMCFRLHIQICLCLWRYALCNYDLFGNYKEVAIVSLQIQNWGKITSGEVMLDWR